MGSDVFILAEHNSPEGIVMVLTDAEIIGQKFETEKLQLDLSGKFYAGEEKSREEVLKRLQKAYIVNFTGERSVALGLELGILDSERVLVIGGVEHAQAWLG